MRLPVWIHHFSQYGDASVGPDDAALPFSEVYVKTHDGLSWMSSYDRGLVSDEHGDPDTGRIHVTGSESITRIADRIYRPQGIVLVPWFVANGRIEPTVLPVNIDGTTLSVAGAEGDMAGVAAVAAASGRLRSRVGVLDLEPSNHGPFWRDDLGAGPTEVDEYVEAFTESGGDELWIAPDARDPWLDRVSFEIWALHAEVVTRVLPQVYWRAFRVEPEDAVARAVAVLTRGGWSDVSGIHPILDGDASAMEMTRAIRFAHRIGCGGVSIFQRKNLSQSTADAVIALDDPWLQRRGLMADRIQAARAALTAIENVAFDR